MLKSIAKKYRFENGCFINSLGARSGEIVDKSKIGSEFSKVGIAWEDFGAAFKELEDLCIAQQKSAQNKQDVDKENIEIVEKILAEQDFLQDFKIFKIGDDFFTYHLKNGRATYIQKDYPTERVWCEILWTHCAEEITKLKNRLSVYLNPKRPYQVGVAEVCDLIAKQLDFPLRKDLAQTLASEIKPVTLSTSDEVSLYKIDYNFEENPQLNPHMGEFLSRVADHEYLCAIIWLMFNGHKAPYLVYLFGAGGEGKTAFLKVISTQVKACVTYQKVNQFSNFHMYGKAMILLCENTDSHLLQDSTVKAITGNNPLTCEEKWSKKSFSSCLSGIFFSDANKMLKLVGEDHELRRLRFFKVSKGIIKKGEELSQTDYVIMLGVNFNAFLNYCRICYGKRGSPDTWIVPHSEQQIADFATFTDIRFVQTTSKVLAKIVKQLNLDFKEHAELDVNIFWSCFYSMPESKEKFLGDNLAQYLYVHCRITQVGNKFIGMHQIDSEHTTFTLPAI